jgi:hypothetical protein
MILNLDVLDGLGVKIGVEMFIERHKHIRVKSRYDQLMESLVKNGLCTPEKRDAFRTFQAMDATISHSIGLKRS